MEQKKILWVVVAMSGFLIIVLGIAMIFYSSARDAAPNLQAATAPVTSVNRLEPITDRAPAEQAGQTANQAVMADPGQAAGGTSPINVTIVNGENASANYTTLDVSGLTGDTGGAVVAANQGFTPNETAAVTSSGSAEPTKPAAAVQSPANPVQTAAPRMETNSPAAMKTVETKAPAAASKTAVKAAPAAAVKPAVTVTEFWIQTGSFNGKLNAEKARDTLKARYLNTEIFTKEVSGATVYRVRVGPYTKKTEADYWLGVVREIQGFKDSYVSEVKTKR